ncbi:hypothetical protein [Frankia sp. KB5]|uniref:hypothetical protein n=1 Tax=Frankia sp. KB5 TaxID=683318 RepID=UPI0018E36138|nr:hypothetical protein [Frankia sp. KB5]
MIRTVVHVVACRFAFASVAASRRACSGAAVCAEGVLGGVLGGVLTSIGLRPSPPKARPMKTPTMAARITRAVMAMGRRPSRDRVLDIAATPRSVGR